MDVQSIAEQIQNKIKEIEDIRRVIKERGETRARASADYDCKLAIILIGLKNGETFELEGKKIIKPPATIAEKIAKGLAWKEKLEMDKADAFYKSAISNMEAVISQLTAYQSLNKYLDRG